MNNQRVFRRHWIVELLIPGIPWFSLSALMFAIVLYLTRFSHYALWLLTLVIISMSKLCQLIWDWLGYSVTAVAGSNVLTVRCGILDVQQYEIRLTELTNVAYKRHWWASLLKLDTADVTILTIGGSFILPTIGDLSDFLQVLRTRGQIIPPKRPPVLGLLREIGQHLRNLASLLISSWRFALHWVRTRFTMWVASLSNRPYRTPRRGVHATSFEIRVNQRARPVHAAMRRPAPVSVVDKGYTYKGVAFSPNTPSYAGFCAFCQQFVIGDKNWIRWHYRTQDKNRRYYPDGIAEHVAQSYLDRLREEYVLIPGPNGCEGERLSRRIRTIEDIQRLIPDFSGSLDKAA